MWMRWGRRTSSIGRGRGGARVRRRGVWKTGGGVRGGGGGGGAGGVGAPAGLLNIGGDVRAWGGAGWPVAIADPANSAENARPLTTFLLRNSAVATSGGYARFYNVDGRRYSHLIDPRTLAPAEELGSAT